MTEAVPKNRTIFTWLWDFFASIKVAIVIIALIAVSAIIGTILPQENFVSSPDPGLYYTQTYGEFGEYYFKFGFSHMYTSWWFVSLLLLLGISLVICSLERVIPLYKSLERQDVQPALSVVQRKEIYVSFDNTDEALLDRIAGELARRRYKIKRKDTAFLAEKMRISRFGAYILHIGLIIIILGALSRLIPGWYESKNIWVEEGQTVAVPGSNFFVRNDDFTVEFYEDGRPKNYDTKAVIIDDGKETVRQDILVNHPLKYKGVLLFQSDYLPAKIRTLDLQLIKKSTQTDLGKFTMDFSNMQTEYKAGNYTIRALDYFPDFVFGNEGPTTRSTEPNNPVLVIQVEGPSIKSPMKQWFFPLNQMSLEQDSIFDVVPVGGKMVQTTGLRIQKDNGIPIVYGGCAVVLLGLFLVFYLSHKRVWGQYREGTVHIGAHVSKNWFGMKREMERIFQAIDQDVEIAVNKRGGK